MHHFSFMARFTAWANARLYACVTGLADEVYRRDCGLFFGSIHGTLSHILVVDRLWTRRIEGAEHDIGFYTEESGQSGAPGTVKAGGVAPPAVSR